MSHDRISLYLTEARAFEAAVQETQRRLRAALPTTYLRVLPATMRDHDGTTDHGFKVLMVPRGETPYYL